MKTALRWTVLGALFLIPFIPLYVANGLFFPFITGKGFAFRILVEVAAVGWLVLALADRAYRPRRSLILFTFLGLIAWMFLADLVAVNPHKAFWSNYERMDGWITLVHTGLFFLVAGAMLTAENAWKKWWLTFLAASALVCAYGVLQILKVLETHQGGRIDATFGNAAYLPAYLLFGIAFALWQGIERTGWMRYLLFALAGLQTFIIFFTATRGALFGLIAAAVVGAFLWAIQTGKRGRNIAVTVVAVIVLLGGAFYAVRDTALVKQSLTLSRLSSVFTLQEELAVRFSIWETGVRGVTDRPLLGYGHEGFNYVFNTYYEPSLYAQEQWFDRAHDIYLDWAIAGGIPALVLFLTLIGYAGFVLFRKEFTNIERTFLVSAFVAYGVQGIVVFDNLFTYVPLAAVLAFIHMRIAKKSAVLEAAPVVHGAALDVAAPVAALAALIIVWIVNVPGISGGAAIIRAFMTEQDPAQSVKYLQEALATGSFGRQEIREQMLTFAMSAATRPDLSDEERGFTVFTTIDELRKEVALVPNDARLRMQLATALRGAGRTDDALREIDAALVLSPQKQTLFIEKGVTLMQAGRYEEARAAFYTAYDFDHSFAQTAAYAAAGDILIGDVATGRALIAERFPESRAELPQIVLVAYQQAGLFDDVLQVLRDRIPVAANNGQARYDLAVAYAQFGRVEEARKEFESLKRDYPEAAASVDTWLTQLAAPQ